MEQLVKLIEILIWPVTVLVIYLLNHKEINAVIKSLMERIRMGAEINIKGVVIGTVPTHLPSMQDKSKLTKEYFALIHSSWRYPKKDLEFKRRMYGIQVILQAQPEVLDEVEYVTYHLHESYPNPLQTKQDRKRNFELKELAWGEYLLKADIKVKGMDEPFHLDRYINLTETGDRLLV